MPKGVLEFRSDGQPFKRVAVPGRNDPCICRSGRKYKQCCMGRVASEEARIRTERAMGQLAGVQFRDPVGTSPEVV